MRNSWRTSNFFNLPADGPAVRFWRWMDSSGGNNRGGGKTSSSGALSQFEERAYQQKLKGGRRPACHIVAIELSLFPFFFCDGIVDKNCGHEGLLHGQT